MCIVLFGTILNKVYFYIIMHKQLIINTDLLPDTLARKETPTCACSHMKKKCCKKYKKKEKKRCKKCPNS